MRCSHYDHHAEVKNFCSKLKVLVTRGYSFHKLGLILKPSTPVSKQTDRGSDQLEEDWALGLQRMGAGEELADDM